MTDRIARPDRYRSRPGVGSKGGAITEAADACCLGDELGGGQRAASEQVHQARREGLGQLADLPCEIIDRPGHLRDPRDEVSRNPSARLGPAHELEVDTRKHDWQRQPARWWFSAMSGD